MEWVQSFYQKQFEFVASEALEEAFFMQEVAKIKEQAGIAFQHVLELGAGDGQVAHLLAQQSTYVTTIDLAENRVAFAKTQATVPMTILQGDFYTIDLPQQFDCILYLDGFGVGEDADQLKLLRRIYHWLTPDGVALIDIYEPNYWRNIYKEPMLPTSNEKVYRIYNYLERDSRFTDTWWHMDTPTDKVTQSLKCYTPEQIEQLCKKAGLVITAYYAGGAVNYEDWTYTEVAPLDHCISYRIKIQRQ
jgi:SAM-dependent methyltransferase